ncbi:MAG: hypothetical protein PHW02_08235 [bacterium]|nr:hypothetical protein [bacterium]
MKEFKRIESLEIVRGIALMFILFFHSSIYNFANIHKIDFSNPPILIVLMSFMALWGGIFVIYSATVNSFMLISRSADKVESKVFLITSISACFYILIHYLLTLFLGRWNIDFVNNMPNLTFVAEGFRHGRLALPDARHLFEGSSISTIAVNLLLMSWLLYFALKLKVAFKRICFYLCLGGLLVIILSVARVTLYPRFTDAIAENNYFLSILCSFFLANPYPVLTYFAYGLFGTLLGVLIYNDRRDIMKFALLPLSALLFAYGVFGMMNFDKTISKPDYFWYFKTNFELGFFIFSITLIYLIFENRKKFLSKLSLIKNFSKVSLTVYMLEVTLSEIFRIVVSKFIPGWNQTINNSLLFGLFNVIVWSLIVTLWAKANFKFSFEYFWVKMLKKFGKESTKLGRI